MKKYLVTGGAGFIGSNLVDKLIELGNEVVIIDDLSAGKKENINLKAKFYQFDICNFDKIKPALEGVDGVFHLAAIPRVPLSIENPVLTSRVNILGTINVFKAAIESGVKRIVFASSSSVYGSQQNCALAESMETNPLSPYGLQKLVGEKFAKMFTELYCAQIISLRYFNVYGPRIDFDSDYSLVLGKFLKLSSQNKPMTIYGDGEQTRAFCYIDDVVTANIKAMESSKVMGGEVINIGQEKSYSINVLAKLVGGEIQYLPKRTGDPLHTQADITLARNLLDWDPKTAFENGVEETRRWFRSNGKL